MPIFAAHDDHGTQSDQAILPKSYTVYDRRLRRNPRPGSYRDTATESYTTRNSSLPPDVAVVRHFGVIVDSHIVLDDRKINGPRRHGDE